MDAFGGGRGARSRGLRTGRFARQVLFRSFCWRKVEGLRHPTCSEKSVGGTLRRRMAVTDRQVSSTPCWRRSLPARDSSGKSAPSLRATQRSPSSLRSSSQSAEGDVLDGRVASLAERQGVRGVGDDSPRDRDEDPRRIQLDRDRMIGSGVLYMPVCHRRLLSVVVLWGQTEARIGGTLNATTSRCSDRVPTRRDSAHTALRSRGGATPRLLRPTSGPR